MISKALQVLQLIAFICALLVAGWFGYRVHQQVQRVEAWVSKIDGILGSHSKWFDREKKAREGIEQRLRDLANRFRSGSESASPAAAPQCKNDECMCDLARPWGVCKCDPCTCGTKKRTIEDVINEADPTPIPIEDTYIQNPAKPTVIMQTMEGCGPCETWWRNNAPYWERMGWVVKREIGTDRGPFPWFKVWDGEKWIEVRGQLTLDSYKKAGGR